MDLEEYQQPEQFPFFPNVTFLTPEQEANLEELAGEAATQLSVAQWTIACIASLIRQCTEKERKLERLAIITGIPTDQLTRWADVFNSFPSPSDRILGLRFTQHLQLVTLARSKNVALHYIVYLYNHGKIRIRQLVTQKLAYVSRSLYSKLQKIKEQSHEL